MDAVVADAWSVLQRGVADVLSRCGVSTVRCVRTATEAIAQAGDAELVVLGALADIAPQVAIARVREANGGARILVLLDRASRDDALRAFDAGADAVLDRHASEHDLRDAAIRVANGDRYISASVLREALQPEPPAPANLTAREVDVLLLLVEGRSNRDIARVLFIGEATVKTHLHRVYEKLGVANRIQAVAAARELDLRRT